MFHTSPGGAGSAHIKFVITEGTVFGALDPGVVSDFKYRVVNPHWNRLFARPHILIDDMRAEIEQNRRTLELLSLRP